MPLAPRVARSLALTVLVALAGCQPPGQTGTDVVVTRHLPGTAHGVEPPPRGGNGLPPDQPAPLPSAAPQPSPSPAASSSPVASAAPSPAAPDLPAGDLASAAPSIPPASAAPSPAASPEPSASPSPAPSPSPTPVPTPHPSPLPRAEADRPDETTDHQVHVVYAVAADGEDRGYDTDGTITRSVYAFDDWLFRKTGKQRIRFDRSGDALDVTYVRLTQTDAQLAANRRRLRDALETELRAKGIKSARKMYAVYYDGTNPEVCGGAPWPPTVLGNVAALYLKGTPDCDGTGWTPDGKEMTYREFAMLHEIMHGLGFVPRNAPHHTLEGHTSGTYADLMYSGSETWVPRVLDSQKEIYDHGRPGVLDLAKSSFLTPSAADAAPPPSWAQSVGD